MILRYTQRFLAILFCVLVSLAAVSAQEKPKDALAVTITQETADKCAKAFDEVAALRDSDKMKTQAIADLKAEIVRLQIDLAKTTGEKTASDAIAIQQREIITVLLKSVRKKQIGLINF